MRKSKVTVNNKILLLTLLRTPKSKNFCTIFGGFWLENCKWHAGGADECRSLNLCCTIYEEKISGTRHSWWWNLLLTLIINNKIPLLTLMRTPKEKTFCTILGRLWLENWKGELEGQSLTISLIMLYKLRGENYVRHIDIGPNADPKVVKSFIPHLG